MTINALTNLPSLSAMETMATSSELKLGVPVTLNNSSGSMILSSTIVKVLQPTEPGGAFVGKTNDEETFSKSAAY